MATGGHSYEEDESYLRELSEAHVLVSCCNEDEFRVRKYILPVLRRQGVKYVSPADHFKPGSRFPSEISSAIKKCKKTLLILTTEAFKGNNFTLEILLSLEQAQRTNCLNLIVLLLDGLNVDDIPKCPVLLNACRARLIDNIHERCLKEIADSIKGEAKLNTVLPAGNFAHGMVWSHFSGYLNIILPELQQNILECDFYKQGNMVYTKLIMLLPMSGLGRKTLEEADSRIKVEGSLKLEIDVGGNKRTYNPTIYSVTDDDGKVTDEPGKKCYFVGEFPSAFCALGLIQEKLNLMTPQQIGIEVQRFYYKMEEILNHDNNKNCRGKANMIVYQDEAKGNEGLPSYQILNAIKEDLHCNGAGPHSQKLEKKFDTDVCLFYDKKDSRFEFHVRTSLEAKRLKCSKAVIPGDSMNTIEERIRAARWTVLFMSKHAIQSSAWTDVWLSEILCMCIEEEELRLLPILIDIEADQVPDYLQWITYVDCRTEKNYASRIAEVVQGRSVTMESQIPVGNVHLGLAYAFFLNYLQHVLPDLKERVERKARDMDILKKRNTVVCPTILEIVPKSCRCPSSITEMDEKIEKVGRVDPIQKDMYGTAMRVYPCTMYKFTADKKEYYFPAEFVSPVRTLRFMNESMIAGLNNKSMEEQAHLLIGQINAILNTTPYGNCKLIYFDDTQDGPELWRVLQEAIDEDMTLHNLCG